jgi:hypothetical protein
MAPRTCSCAAYDHRSANQDQRDHGQNPANDNERLKFPIGGLQPRVKRHKPGEERQQRKNRRGDGEGRYRRHPHHDPFNMVDRLVRFFLELEFGGCERLIQASRYGSLSAHEFANRRAQTCDVIAKSVSSAALYALSRLAQSLISRSACSFA